MRRLALSCLLGVCCGSAAAEARTIRISPDAGTYADIEGARAGDEVVIAPGTYRFRVFLQSSGTAAQPLVVRAEDPARPPLFDYRGAGVSAFPGAANANPERSAWLIDASDVEVRDVRILGARSSTPAQHASGLRVLGGARLRVWGVEVQGCEHGLETVGGDVTVDHARLVGNDSALQHYGGTLVLRGSTLSGSVQGNFYLGGGDATLEANWIAQPGVFPGIVTTCELGCGGSGVLPVGKTVVLRGNVFLQSTTQSNTTLLLAVNQSPPGVDGTGSNTVLDLWLLYNTLVGFPGTPAAAITFNAATTPTRLHAYGNAIDEVSAAVATSTGVAPVVDSAGNWVQRDAGPDTLPGSLSAASAGFRNRAALDLRPAPGSPLIGGVRDAGAFTPPGPPRREYALEDVASAAWRVRATALDVGAFEHDSAGPALGSTNDPGEPPLDGGVDGGQGTGGAGGPRALAVGCDCASSTGAPGVGLLGAFTLLWALRRSGARAPARLSRWRTGPGCRKVRP